MTAALRYTVAASVDVCVITFGPGAFVIDDSSFTDIEGSRRGMITKYILKVKHFCLVAISVHHNIHRYTGVLIAACTEIYLVCGTRADKPKIVTTDQDLVVLEGVDATLPCRAVGNPVPAVIWKKLAGQLPQSR